MACRRGPVRQGRRVPRLLVHVLANWSGVPPQAARPEQGRVSSGCPARSCPWTARFSRQRSGWLVPVDSARRHTLDRPRLAPQARERRSGLVGLVPLCSQGVSEKGVTSALIEAALRTARRAGVPALEAYPFDAEISGTSTSTGYASTFSRAGFETVERRIAARPIMRHDLRAGGARERSRRRGARD